MRHLTIIAVSVALFGCKSKDASLPEAKQQSVKDALPKKVTDLLALIKELKPETKEQVWLELVDRTIDLPEEDILLYGGSDLGCSWEALGIGAGDEWALSIEYLQTGGQIWEAKVIRTSISKVLAYEPCKEETIYPHYYKGHVVWSQDERLAIDKRQEVEQAVPPNGP
jgi:hypothetical protein